MTAIERAGPGAQSGGSGWRMLARDLRAVRGPLIWVIVLSTAQVLPTLASGRVLALALDRGFLDHRPVAGLLYLLVLGGCLLAGAAATRVLFPWLAKTVEPVRDVLVTRLVTATIQDAVARTDTPDTVAVARLTGQVETVRGLVGAILRSARPSAVSMLAAVVGLLSLAPATALFVLVPLAISGAVFVLSLRSLAHRQRAVVLADEAIAAESGWVINAVRDIIACNAQDRAVARAAALIGAQATTAIRLGWAGAQRTVTVSLGGELPLVGLLTAGSWLVRDGRLSAGELIGAISYVSAGMLPAIRSLVTVTTTWGVQFGVVLGRIHEAVVAVARAPAAPIRSTEPSGYAISLRRLGFGYGAGAEPVIQDLCLDIPEGDHLVIVGPSGAGKSTLTQLLVGGLRPDRGEVQLGGVPVPELPWSQLHRIETLIPQESYIFAGTLRENLAYLAPDADDGRLADAAQATGLTALIQRLGGLDAEIGVGGVALSSGEAQLVAVTRVFLSDAKVVILDEATCHLDQLAEARAEEAFKARPGTLIVVAHRISSALRANRILLLDGRGTVLGTPDDLPARSPLYADLLGYWTSGAVSRQVPARQRTA